MRRSGLATRAVALSLLALLLAGCADQALVDRVAAIEDTQQQLRRDVAAVSADDPDQQAAMDATTGRLDELETAVGGIDTLEEQLVTARADLDALQQEVEGATGAIATQAERTDGLTTELGELRSALARLQDQVNQLDDRVSSLATRFGRHEDDPGAHAGAAGSP